jgi:hypothetical protein
MAGMKSGGYLVALFPSGLPLLRPEFEEEESWPEMIPVDLQVSAQTG